MAKDYGLLIAALVAIVAIVGLVILFNGSATGAVVDPGNVVCPNGQQLQSFVGSAGKLSYVVCVPVAHPGIPASLY